MTRFRSLRRGEDTGQIGAPCRDKQVNIGSHAYWNRNYGIKARGKQTRTVINEMLEAQGRQIFELKIPTAQL